MARVNKIELKINYIIIVLIDYNKRVIQSKNLFKAITVKFEKQTKFKRNKKKFKDRRENFKDRRLLCKYCEDDRYKKHRYFYLIFNIRLNN